MAEPKTWRWFDHKGGIVSTPATDVRPTAFGPYDRLNHWMFGEPSETAWFQAMTLCGRRALEISGRGDVDCPECIEVAGPNEADRLASGEICQPGQPAACGDFHNAGQCVKREEADGAR